MSSLRDFRASLRNRNHPFSETLAFIANAYDYQPTRFLNGNIENAAGQNEGSCKTLGLAVLEGFTTEEALLAFGEHYQSVLENSSGTDHQNIRALMDTGLPGVRFDQQPLRRKPVNFVEK
ncbi:HopJ type III effector protein [Stutzerimonas xanthomarina]|uniref:HopJ type III effector protein n=1 Tax=Stutzerimonas xanthomarina TaxID=271420 RepID=UPI003AA82B4D